MSVRFILSRSFGIDYISFRVWIGFWTCVICIVLVATDASALVRYFTRFTEEAFSSLISFIFIVEAFENLFEISHEYPIKTWVFFVLSFKNQDERYSNQDTKIKLNLSKTKTSSLLYSIFWFFNLLNTIGIIWRYEFPSERRNRPAQTCGYFLQNLDEIQIAV